MDFLWKAQNHKSHFINADYRICQSVMLHIIPDLLIRLIFPLYSKDYRNISQSSEAGMGLKEIIYYLF